MSDATDLKNQENEKNDHEYVRETYYDLVEKGRHAIEEMLEVSKDSQHPRAYEVLATLIKNTGDVAEKLPAHHIKNHEIRRLRNPGNQNQLPGGEESRVMIIGTTADLLQEIQREEKDITPSE